MKYGIPVFIWLISLQLIPAQQADEQKYRVDIDALNAYEALFQLARITQYNFVYDVSMVNSQQAIRLKLKDATLDKILSRILPETYNGYQIIDKQIILLPPDENTDPPVSQQLTGSIIDKTSGKAIAYASVSFLNAPYGTISNIEGKYNLKLYTEHIADTLIFGALGYTYKKVAVKTLINRKSIVGLQQFIVPIQEVYVRRKNPVLLTRQSIQASTKDYLNKNTLSDAFYREYILKNAQVQSLYEASLKYLQSTGRYTNTKVKITEAVRAYDIRNTDTVKVKLQGGLYSLKMLDILQQLPEFFDVESMHLYQYEFSDILNYLDKNVYVINFKPHKTSDEAPYTGTLYIGVDNMKLMRADIEILHQNAQSFFDVLNRKNSRHINSKLISSKYTINYDVSLPQIRLRHIRVEIYLKVKKHKTFFAADYKLVSEILLDNWEPVQKDAITRRESDKSGEVFTEIIKKYTGPLKNKAAYLPAEEVIDKSLFGSE